MSIEFSECYRHVNLRGVRQSEVFKLNDQYYLADLTIIPFCESELMIFKSNKYGKVKDWFGCYCQRGIEVTHDNLLRCIQEFIDEHDNQEGR